MRKSLDADGMRAAITLRRLQWQRHALERMVQRNVTRDDVVNVLLNGERIEDYPEDCPFPSGLFLGWSGERALHVVAAFDPDRETVAVITVYEPTAEHFEQDFRTRRKP